MGAVLKGRGGNRLCQFRPSSERPSGLLVLWKKSHYLRTAGETRWAGLDETLVRGLITVNPSGLCSLKLYISGYTKIDMVPLNWEQLETREGGISDCIFKPSAFIVIQSIAPLNFLRQQLL